MSYGALATLAWLILLTTTPLELYDPGPKHQGLVAALRIQLRGELIERPALEAQSKEDRIQKARAQLLADTAAAWVETSSTGDTDVVVLGARDGLPYVESVPLDGRPGFDRDRATALKIYEVLTLPRAPPDTPRDAAPPRRSPRGFGLSAELGGMGSIGDRDAGLRGGLFAALGPHLETMAWRFELRTGAHLISDLQEASAFGSVAVGEWGWSIGLAALARLDDIQLGPVFAMRLRVLNAESTTESQGADRETLLVPALAAGVDFRTTLTKRLSVRMYLGAGVNLERRPFALDDAPRVDLGRWFGEAQVSLLISIL